MPTNNPPSPVQIAERLRDFYSKKNQGPANFGVPKTPEAQLNKMPNAHKLTKLERGIYGALPGVTTWMENHRIMGKTISEQLDKFNNSWAGKALNYLDVAAEGFERFVGTGEQILREGVRNFDFDTDNLRAAWYASSLYYDTLNLPQWKRGKDGKIVGLKVPTDLPGVDGLIDARIKLKRLIEQGQEPDEALRMVRDDYYNGLGALALRAQLNDFYGHALGDPTTYLAGYLKPVQALKARRIAALSNKLVGGVEGVVSKADEVGRLIRTADNIEDSLKYADEAFELSSMAGDTKRAAQYAQQAAEIAQRAGKVDDAKRFTEAAAKFTNMTAGEAQKFTDDALMAIGRKKLTTADKFAIMVTGGDPLRPTNLPGRIPGLIEKVPGLGKMFTLTPESKAKELVNLVSDNISSHVISRMMNNTNAEADLVGYIRRVAKGATGIEYGHAMMTLEGRTVQAFVKGVESSIERMFNTYQQLGKERDLLKALSDVLGEAPSKLLRQLDESPDVIMDMLLKKQGINPALDLMVQAGELNIDALRSLSKTMGNMPYNREMFFAQVVDAIETQAMRQAVVQFGVQSKGVLTRWSDAMKAAESLAFLRLSPGYPVRNKFNNDMTMIARGLFGHMPDEAITKFWDDFGVQPKRLGEAIGPVQEKNMTEALSEADKILNEALQGGYYGTPDKIKDFFQKVNLGKLDFAKYWGQKIEQRASRKAFTLGTQQFLRRLYTPKGIEEYGNPRLLDEIEDLAPGFRQTLNNVIRASGASETKFDELLGTNLNLNVDSILDEVSQALQTEVRDLLGDELLEHIHRSLPDALNNGNLETLRLQTRQMANQHIEDLFNKQIENVVEHVKSQAVAGGPNVWAQKLGEAQDIFWGAHIEHSIRMPEATRLAREASRAGDFKTARALWKQEQADAGLFYDRAFRRVDAYIQGLEEGAKELQARGAKLPFTEVRRAFKEFRDGWAKFFEEKNRLMDDFWNEFDNGGRPSRSIDDVQRQIQSMYDAMAEKEDELGQRVDDLIASMITDPDAKKAYMNARDTLADLKRADKKAVNELYRRAAEVPAEERQALFNEFWAQRTQKYQTMRSVDQASVAIQQGDPTATQMFSQARQAAKEGEFDIFRTAEEFGIETTTRANKRNTRRVLNTVNKYSEQKFKDLKEVPEDVARAAFEKRAAEKGTQVPKQGPEVTPDFIADVNKVIPNPAPIDLGLDMMMYGRSYGALDAIIDGAKAAAQRTPTLVSDLPAHLQDEVRRMVRLVKNDFANTRYQAMKFGEWRRDSALLNYNRRTNFDNYLGHMAPFVFWTTSSMFQWAIESIDRPAMFANYLRVKKFMETNGLQRDGMPTRTKGKIRVQLPFAPEWMGEQFIDPLRIALPFDNWATPFEQLKKNQESLDGRAERLLEQQLQEGSISQEEYEQAISTKAGPVWDFARTKAAGNDNNDTYDTWDFATALAAPHAPIMWAFNAAMGNKEEIGPFTPMSRVFRNAATMLGVEDWNNSKWNLEAKVRRQMGLPAFDRWDDYRIDRSLANLAGSGEFTVDEVKEAMAISALVQQGKLTPEQAKQMSEAYREGVKRSYQETTGGPLAGIMNILGVPVTSVPEGELELRKLQDDFSRAYESYKKANDSLQDYLDAHPDMEEELAQEAWAKANPKLANAVDDLTEFFDRHPEYETRLGLFDSPEEKVHKFMIDELWSHYNQLPKLNKDEVREHLGEEFQTAFLNKETRAYDQIPTEMLSVWLKMMNVDPLGGLTADQNLLVKLYGKVKMTDPETANRVEVFYQTRNRDFENWYDVQSEYYKKETKAAKRKYLAEHPELKQYWDWRKNFMRDNPDLVPYLTDDQEAIERAKNQARTETAVPTAAELQKMTAKLPPDVRELVFDFAQTGEPLPPVVIEELEYFAAQSGLDPQQYVNILGGGLGVR